MVPSVRRYENPFEMLRDMDRFFNRAVNGADEGMGTAAYPVDIHEDENHIYVEAELPGFKREEIEVNFDQGVLTINASRQSEEQQGETHLNERRFTRVSRRFSMPNTVDTGKVQAKLEDGVLRLTLPKREEVKPRRIEVK